MKANLKRLMPCLGLLVLLAGCGTDDNPVAPVVIPPLSSIVVTPAADTLDVGESRLFTAVAVDTAGDPYTGSLAWRSTDSGVFTVTSSGLVTARGEGSARLVVSGGGQADTADVLVYPTAAGWVVQTSNAGRGPVRRVLRRAPAASAGSSATAGSCSRPRDAGATWTRRVPTTYDLRGVWFTSATEGWAVGDGGTVLHTLNGGADWTRAHQRRAAARTCGTSTSPAATRAGSWATNGQILATSDRGATWSRTWRGGQTLNGVMFAGARRLGGRRERRHRRLARRAAPRGSS